MTIPFIPKEDSEMPDYYEITIKFVEGSTATYKAVGHKILEKVRIMEIITHEDTYVWIPLDMSAMEIKFDKNFTKVVLLSKKKEKDNAA
jgi:hypothetical protein